MFRIGAIWHQKSEALLTRKLPDVGIACIYENPSPSRPMYSLENALEMSVDLISCDNEPIHIPGSIQPHGALIVLSEDDTTIVQCAGNTVELLGFAPAALLGKRATAVMSPAHLAALLDNLRTAARADRVLVPMLVASAAAGKLLNGVAYRSGATAVIEFEAASEAGDTRVVQVLCSMQRELVGSASTADLCDRIVTTVRTATGFDRVMVYEFLPDGTGVVTSEARDPSLEAFLGLHYPASDIPKQARALYLTRWLRLIPDVGYTPAPLQPSRNPTGKPVDLGQGGLRSVSPIHLEYLTNMGVRATMTVSLVVNGALWGLIACHHQTPKYVPGDVRTACELFAEMASLQIATRSLQQRGVNLQANDLVLRDLVLGLLEEPDLGKALTSRSPNLLDLIPAAGASVWTDGRATSCGRAPSAQQIAALVPLLEGLDGQMVVTDRLPEMYPAATEFADVASGLLALPLSQSPPTYALWYLPELVHSVSWGGDPTKSVTTGPLGARLTPRASFAAWQQQVRNRSRIWQPGEIAAAESLRLALLDVVLRQVVQAAAEREQAIKRQDMLMAELDHRVKNMLATIQALVRQSRVGQTTLDGFLQGFENRLLAMSRAHNVLATTRWEGVDLNTLVRHEMEPYLSAAAPQVIISAGINILLRPKSALAICLAVHELATNAGKYGALSVPDGRVHVHWARAGREICLRWRESGGPPVRKPAQFGFGTKLITKSLSYEIDGTAVLDFETSGVVCTITIPEEEVTIIAGSAAQLNADIPVPRQNLNGVRVLIVEDNAMIASETTDAINQMGAIVIGPVARLAAALRQIDKEPFDVAVLDVDLNGTMVWPLAEELAKRGIPFCFATGFDAKQVIPADLSDRIVLNKPYLLENLEKALMRLLSA